MNKKVVIKIIKYILVYGLLLVGPLALMAILQGVIEKQDGRAVSSDDFMDSPYFMPAVALGTLLNIIVFLWRRWAVLDLGRIRRADLWMVVVMALGVFLGWFLPEIFLQGLVEVPDNLTDKEFEQLTGGVLGFIDTAILAPVAEELLCRGAILGVLLKAMPRRPWVGIVVSAIIFGLYHMNPVQTVFGFLYGLPLGWLAWRTGSLLPGIVVHVANNTTAILMPAEVDKAIGGMSLATESLLVLVSLVVLIVALRWFAQRYETNMSDSQLHITE